MILRILKKKKGKTGVITAERNGKGLGAKRGGESGERASKRQTTVKLPNLYYRHVSKDSDSKAAKDITRREKIRSQDKSRDFHEPEKESRARAVVSAVF